LKRSIFPKYCADGPGGSVSAAPGVKNESVEQQFRDQVLGQT
jgi:hypothetical protein